MAEGTYISDVFLGFRHVPHLAIAIKHHRPDGSFYVLRATLEHQFTSMLSQDEGMSGGDIFLINTKGMLQTPSRYFGNVLKTIPIAFNHINYAITWLSQQINKLNVNIFFLKTLFVHYLVC